MRRHRWLIPGILGLAVALVAAVAGRWGASAGPGQPTLQEVIRARGLTPDQVLAAVQTYVPPGKYDEYLMFSSGGQSGQVLVYGLPSMRLLRVIGVFAPEPWQGYGFSKESREILAGGEGKGESLAWGDTHHPALSETKGEYDGQYLFINDKANARIAVIDLRDFSTKQIVRNPNAYSNHGAVVSPDTDYVLEATQYAAPFPPGYRALSQEAYNQHYRGLVTFWRFDRARGRIDPARSFQIEVPPYWQDLADFGRLESDGWAFINSFNTERAIGGTLDKQPPMEIGASARDVDYLHIINYRRAAELVAQGRARTVNGIKVLSLRDAVEGGVLYFAPEPKSPHGVDVAPRGDYIVVGGKLDPNVTVYSFRKIQQAVRDRAFSGRDPYGVPILAFDRVVAAQVKVGLGPLHTQFDDRGNAYTSLFLDSAVAKWTLGEPYHRGGDAWKLVDTLPVQYNIGHLATVMGDTARPGGKYLVALNKWSVDQYRNVGPLFPQNLQLIDISGEKMRLLSNTPVGLAEPHLAQIIPLERVTSWAVYPQVGINPLTMQPDPQAVTAGKERIERRGRTVEVWMTAMRSHFTPDRIRAKKGDTVIIHITNIERAKDAIHGFAIDRHNINLSLEPGKTETVIFTADRAGVFPFYCTEFCSALHLEMAGYLEVEP
ncbi:MAG: Sec-dependent nitrous-oxide reductase [Armatimonadota bacterium]|nr:Sec-dependent nitrous-oxide reductase [Armatimonadota bacterium]MDR7436918.1 Sec-dependent nitrous-oxide reductase [Armatimonadota bacterium]MDR7472308.1 Sec-dependent nitrous-oxide reductase [Armatimonadota bacterium]MDR7506389.1 Sec-dependent nitrous-oxide reductase [Armatimonadota bacterium]MDR7508396.1 Sec-dependent nitrous-oxide reductase [Armatimonadota bacterium]